MNEDCNAVCRYIAQRCVKIFAQRCKLEPLRKVCKISKQATDKSIYVRLSTPYVVSRVRLPKKKNIVILQCDDKHYEFIIQYLELLSYSYNDFQTAYNNILVPVASAEEYINYTAHISEIHYALCNDLADRIHDFSSSFLDE